MKKFLLSALVVLSAPSVFANCISLDEAKTAIVTELSKDQHGNANKFLGTQYFDAGVNNFLQSLSLKDGVYTTTTEFAYNTAQAGEPVAYVTGIVIGEVNCDGTSAVVTALDTP